MSEEMIVECCGNELPYKNTPCPCGCHYDSEEEVAKAEAKYNKDCEKKWGR